MFKYSGTIAFESDAELTPEQMAQLISVIEVQIQEPADSDGDDEEFVTNNVTINLRSLK